MSMGIDNLVGIFYTCVTIQCHQQGVSKGIVCIFIPRTGRVRKSGTKYYSKSEFILMNW